MGFHITKSEKVNTYIFHLVISHLAELAGKTEAKSGIKKMQGGSIASAIEKQRRDGSGNSENYYYAAGQIDRKIMCGEKWRRYCEKKGEIER